VLLPPADLGRELGGGLVSCGLPPRGLALALRGVGFREEGDFEPCRGLLKGPGRRMEPASEMRGTGGSQLPLFGSFSADLPFTVVPHERARSGRVIAARRQRRQRGAAAAPADALARPT
jgi:hypothetical protein